MLSISGFGANNADSRRAAYAPIIHAETGLIARQAELTGAFPTELPLSVADTKALCMALLVCWQRYMQIIRAGRPCGDLHG